MPRPTDPPAVSLVRPAFVLAIANAVTSPPPFLLPGRAPGSRLKRHPLLRCLAIYAHMPRAFAAVFALFVVANVGLALQQHAIGRAITDLQQGRAVTRIAGGALSYRVALVWLGIIAVVALVRAVIQYGAGVLALVLQQELLSRLRVAILAHVQALDLSYHRQHGMGEIVTRTTRDADKLRDALVSFWRNVVETALVVTGTLALLFWYAPILALGPVVATALGLAWLLRTADRLVAIDREVGAAFDAVNQDLSEGVHGVRVIKAFALEPLRIARFGAAVEAFAGHARRALAFGTRHIPAPQVVVALGQVWVLVCGAQLVHAGRLPVGSLVASLLIMNTLIFRVEAVGRVMQVFADARSSAARIMEIFDAAPGIVSGSAPVPQGPLGIKLERVGVRAGGDRLILSGCSLTVAPGEVVAVVGATGAGKSTLTALLPRLVDADAGRVLVGSDEAGWTDVRQVDLAALRRRVHVVPQEAFLFSDTVAANLRMAEPRATPDELARAVHLAAADDVVVALPEGLETVVGDRGVTLSGGQRQRLTLARAFVSAPAVLALDDATSALDAVTERTVLDNVRALAERGAPVTTLLVASKLSTVLLADRVVVLADGRIAASGTHAELARTSRAYRELMGIDDAAAA